LQMTEFTDSVDVMATYNESVARNTIPNRLLRFLRTSGLYYTAIFFKRIKRRGFLCLCKDIINVWLTAIGIFSDHLISRPVYAQIEPTSRCNLRCRMCIINTPGHETHDMRLSDFKHIISKLPRLLFLNIQGNGEPLLNKDLFSMIDYARQHGIATVTCTNATLLDEHTIKRLLLSGLFELGISIESADKDMYEYIRRGAKFEQVVSNIKKLLVFRDTINPELIIKFWITLINHTADEVERCIDFAARLGMDGIVFQQVQTKEDYTKNYSSHFSGSPQLKKNYTAKTFKSRYGRYARRQGISVRFIERCFWPWAGMYITAGGHVTPCCIISDYKSYSSGNLLLDDMDKVWNTPLYKTLRNTLRKKRKPACCNLCSFR